MSDFDKLKELFDSWGVKCTVEEYDDWKPYYSKKWKLSCFDDSVKPRSVKQIIICEDMGIVEGFSGFYACFTFDKKGKFIKIGLFE